VTSALGAVRLETGALDAGAAATIREIGQQPALWREVDRIVAVSQDSLNGFLQPLTARGDLRVVLTGAGTSAHAGQILRTALAGRLGRRVDAVATTDIVADPRACFAEDVPTLLVSFARSGDSPESAAATALADQCLSDCHHLVITCNAQGRLAREHSARAGSYVLLMPAASDDEGFAMTSSFTCMTLAALLTLGGAPYDGLAGRLADAAEQVMTTAGESVRALVTREPKRIVYLGSGALRGLAAESALKVLELTAGAIVATSESALGFRHGPKAVLDDRTAVIVYVSNDPYTRQYDLDLLAELRADSAPGNVVAIAGRAEGLPGEDSWVIPAVAGAEDAALALPAVVYAQLIGLQASLSLGLTPDNPFPSGQVNRVVRGVTVHPLKS
jgi:tagatose-6-phosphate ketose/aldose isomerase